MKDHLKFKVVLILLIMVALNSSKDFSTEDIAMKKKVVSDQKFPFVTVKSNNGSRKSSEVLFKDKYSTSEFRLTQLYRSKAMCVLGINY